MYGIENQFIQIDPLALKEQGLLYIATRIKEYGLD
tara:strand:+ start:148 stop:252 length:105 start_codon:yes stop_codon:yes gene_type:complete